MDYGCGERRKTKGDLKRKRLNRGYKRGGQFRTSNVVECSSSEEEVTKKTNKKNKRKNRKY